MVKSFGIYNLFLLVQFTDVDLSDIHGFTKIGTKKEDTSHQFVLIISRH